MEDQGVGLDLIMLFLDSESQLGDGDVPHSEDKAVEEDNFVVPETPEEDWPMATLEEQAVERPAEGIDDAAASAGAIHQLLAVEELTASMPLPAAEEHLRKKPAPHLRLGNMLKDWRRALFDDENQGLEKGKEDQGMDSVKKNVTTDQFTSISDAETDDEGIATQYNQSGDLRGLFHMHEDGKVKELVTDMLCILIPAYHKVVKKISP